MACSSLRHYDDVKLLAPSRTGTNGYRFYDQGALLRLQISVQATLAKLEKGEQLMAEEIFNGFEHAGHREEVEQRWGKEAYADGDKWWRSKTAREQREYQVQHEKMAADYGRAKTAGLDAGSDQAQEIAGRHFDWLQLGAQARNVPVTAEYFAGLAQMYPSDPRFAAQYGGTEGACYVRDVMTVYAQREL